jgi:hypothetical protein
MENNTKITISIYSSDKLILDRLKIVPREPLADVFHRLLKSHPDLVGEPEV